MKQKMALIQQIRAMEATPVIRQKLVDLSEKAGHGLLSEMSISEVGPPNIIIFSFKRQFKIHHYFGTTRLCLLILDRA